MLILSRKIGQSFKVGNDVTITIKSVDGGQVKVGISAPREVSIMRSELLTEQQDAGDKTKRKLEHDKAD